MKNVTARQIMGINLKGDREKDDYYSTPVEALESLLNVEKFEGDIFEPCCGEGHISKHLVKEGFNVESSDLMDRGYGKSIRNIIISISRFKRKSNKRINKKLFRSAPQRTGSTKNDRKILIWSNAIVFLILGRIQN